MKKNLLTLILTAMITLSLPLMIYAGQQEYSISAIDLIVKVTDELNVLTRNVTDSNPALEKLDEDADAASVRTTFIQNNIYLNAFPDDLAYELVITASEINSENVVNFKDMADSEFTDYINNVKAQFDASEHEELLEIDIYENNTSKYIRSYAHSTLNDASVYVTRYYTVINGYNYYFTLQTNDLEIDDTLENTVKSVVDSANYTEVKGSVTESALFMEFYEMLMGFGLTVLILGVILFMLIRTSKTPKR